MFMIAPHIILINLWVGNSYYEGRTQHNGKHCTCPPMTKLLYANSSLSISYICQNILVVDVIVEVVCHLIVLTLLVIVVCTSSYCIDMPLLQ